MLYVDLYTHNILTFSVCQWAVPRGVDKAPARPFVVADIEDLVKEGYDLCVTGSTLQKAVALDETFWRVVKHVKIWARMSPEDKEAVLRALKEQVHTHVYVHTYIYAYIHVRMSPEDTDAVLCALKEEVFVCMYACMYVCIHACVCVYMRV